MKYYLTLKLINEKSVAMCIVTEFGWKVVSFDRNDIMRLTDKRPSEVAALIRECRENKKEVLL